MFQALRWWWFGATVPVVLTPIAPNILIVQAYDRVLRVK